MMLCFTVKTALLLCGLSWIYLSVTECRMVEVQPGEDVTLLCSNFSSSPSQIIWYKLVNGTYPRCISSIFSSTQPASFCSGVEPDRFGLTSNSSTLFFKIKQVDLADSGFYFCGFYYKTHPVIVNSTYLQVQGSDNISAEESVSLMSVILSGVTVVLNKVIIALVVKKRLYTEMELEYDLTVCESDVLSKRQERRGNAPIHVARGGI